MGNFLRLSLIALVISITASCGGGGDGKRKTSPTTECPENDPYCNSDYAELKIKTTDNRIWLALTAEYNTLQATPQGRPNGGIEFEDISTKNLEFWTSSNTSVATVNQDGLITAVSIGETYITYELEITQGVRQPVTKRIIVKESSVNTPPAAIAGDDFQIYGGDEVNLDGTASYDLDGEIIDWYWTVKSGNIQGEDITGNKTSTPSFFAPNSKQNQQIILELTVRDNNDDSHTDSIAITILPSSTQNAPTVTLEKPSDIIEGQSVTLVGSFDDIDETAKSCEWSWSDDSEENADGNNRQLITEIIEPCPQLLPVLTFTPDPESVPGDVYITLLVTDWLDQTSKMTQKFTVAEKTIETVMHKVTTNAGDGGTISPEEQEVVENSRQEFILDPDNENGFIIDTESVKSTCGGKLEGNTYLTDPITEPCSVSANFKLDSYEITTSVIETGGTISQISINPITHGEYAEVEISSTEGYELKSFSGTCGDMTKSEEFANRYLSVNPITGECSIKAEFQKKEYSITTSVSGGQSTPSSPLIEHGGQVNLELTPNTGYTIENNNQVTGLPEGSACDTGTLSYDEENNTYDYLIEDIQEECSVNINFSKESYVVSTEINVSGDGDPTGAGTINTVHSEDLNNIEHGTTIDFTIEAGEGYRIETISGCNGTTFEGTNSTTEYTYSTGKINQECDVTATFKLIQYTVTANIITTDGFREGGKINSDTATPYHNEKVTFTIDEIYEGYSIVNATGCNGSLSGNSYNTGKIIENCEVTITFSPNRPTLSFAPWDADWVKAIKFNWTKAEAADYYQLIRTSSIDVNGSVIVDDIASETAETLLQDISVHLFDWETTEHHLLACQDINENGIKSDDACVESNSLSTIENNDVNSMLDSIGYFKAFPEIQKSSKFGRSVALSSDGNTLAVIAPGLFTGPTIRIHIFRRNVNGWIWESIFYPYSAEDGDMYKSLAISADGNTLIVGAVWEDGKDKGVGGNPFNNDVEDSGAAFLYRFSDNKWKSTYIKAPNTDSDDGFGQSVSISADGNTIAIGAPYEKSSAIGICDAADEICIASMNNNETADSGAVYVYNFSNDVWENTKYIKPSINSESSGFGYSVALSSDGNSLLVGSSGISTAYLYRKTNLEWNETKIFQSYGLYDSFGYSVALSSDGNTAVVGAPYDSSYATGTCRVESTECANTISSQGPYASGAVYHYRFDNNEWQSPIYIKPLALSEYSLFGSSIALSSDGSNILIGTHGEASNSTGVCRLTNSTGCEDKINIYDYHWSGAAYLITEANEDLQISSYIKSPNAESEDLFGISVSMSSDGKVIAIGAPDEDNQSSGINNNDRNNNDLYGSGAVYLY